MPAAREDVIVVTSQATDLCSVQRRQHARERTSAREDINMEARDSQNKSKILRERTFAALAVDEQTDEIIAHDCSDAPARIDLRVL